MHPLTESFSVNNRINLQLLEGIDDTWLEDQLISKGRKVGEQFAHIHNVRLMWIKVSAPDLLLELNKIEKEDAFDKSVLLSSLSASAQAVSLLIEHSVPKGKVKNFKRSVEMFVSYLIAHEAHHRSQIVLACKQSGHKMDPKVLYKMWEWG